jgi:undecaprenyl-diphosphatase
MFPFLPRNYQSCVSRSGHGGEGIVVCEAGAIVSALGGPFAFVGRIDHSIIELVNQFSQRHWYLDRLATFLSGNNLFKSGLIMAVLWWLWFRFPEEERRKDVRERILLTIAVAFVAIFLARLLAFSLPFRVRPVEDASLGFVLPLGLEKHDYWNWSSFPSDHAVLFFSLAMSIRYISKRLSWGLFAYAFLAISLPRLYLGVHYPSDIVVGALIGIGMAWLANIEIVRQRLKRLFIAPAMAWLGKSPGVFYAFLFLLTYQIADMFDQVRSMGRLAISVIRHIL